MFAKIIEKAVGLIVTIVPANSIAGVIASLVTKALSKIKNKDKLAKISEAVGACGKAVNITAEACKDGEITESEVNEVSDSIEVAVVKIIEASK